MVLSIQAKYNPCVLCTSMVWTKKDRDNFGNIIETYGFVFVTKNYWRKEYSKDQYFFAEIQSTQRFKFWIIVTDDKGTRDKTVTFVSNTMYDIFPNLMDNADVILNFLLDTSDDLFWRGFHYHHSVIRNDENIFTRRTDRANGFSVYPKNYFSTKTGFSIVNKENTENSESLITSE